MSLASVRHRARARARARAAVVVGRLRGSRPARAVRDYAWHPLRLRDQPLLSVVVPFHDVRRQLPGTLQSLISQDHRRIEIVLVDDGSTDGSREVADRFAAEHRRVRVVEQSRSGVGAARNRGVAAARGTYLAFCDADDAVPATAYARMVGTLEASGSDLVVGSVSLEEKGRFDVPDWARRSNPQRRVGATLEDVPWVLGNLMVGSRMFRRSFWDRHRLSFGKDERTDAQLVVSSLLAAERLDVVPAVVYRWSWRDDNRSLLQRDLRDKARVAERVRAVVEPGRLLVAHESAESSELQQHYFAEVLHSVVADLVRAAVCRYDGYWEALTTELGPLVSSMPIQTLRSVPVEDRVIAWLCAHDERAATEEFLEYSFDNRTGYPTRLDGGRPVIALPFVDALADVSEDLTRVSESDLRFRSRLMRLSWTSPSVLRVDGGAFVEYLDDRVGPSRVTLVLRDRVTEREVRVPTRAAPEVGVNQWAGRANEDHAAAGFTAEIDLTELPLRPTDAGGESDSTHYDVSLELEIGGHLRHGRFVGRNASASPGLLEPSVAAGLAMTPTWRDHRGLGLALRTAGSGEVAERGRRPRVRVDRVEVAAGRLRLAGVSRDAVELALVGPRGGTTWTATGGTGRFEVDLDVHTDEWGLGRTALPADTYDVRARQAGRELPVACDPVLWRTLPAPVDSDSLTFTPQVGREGVLRVRVVPREWQHSRPAFLRRRLRDEVYPQAKEQPLTDTVLFETFAGKGTGDNPGAICAELHRRDLGLDLVYSVLDRSHVVPEGARGVVRWSEEWFELLGRARYLVVNASLPYFFRKREGQLYFQTWHGTPLKRIAHDRPHLDFFNWHHRRQLLVARSGWDYLLSQSEFCGTALSSAFRYDGPLLEVGYPRDDVLSAPHRDAVRRRVREHFGIGEHTRAVLYAPTWRDNLRVGAVFNKVLYLDPLRVVDELEDTVVLVRGHYNSVGAAEQREASGRILDVTRYPDIADLYLAADVLVTDYSSVFFDFSITDKPMVFLAPDLTEYRDDNRGFYLDYHEVVPGPVCLDTSEVIEALTAPDGFVGQRRTFRAAYNPHDDGGASARVVDQILADFPPGGSRPGHSRPA